MSILKGLITFTPNGNYQSIHFERLLIDSANLLRRPVESKSMNRRSPLAAFGQKKLYVQRIRWFCEGMGYRIRATRQASNLSGNHFHTDAE